MLCELIAGRCAIGLGFSCADHWVSVEEYAETQGWVYAARRGKGAGSGRPRL